MRTDVPSWDQTWVDMVELISRRSKDPRMQVGAVAVSPDNKQSCIGYNGFPSKIKDTPERWERPTKYDHVIHAEENALLNCPVRLDGWTLYVTLPPCKRCAPKVIQAGIVRVVYIREPLPDSDLDYKFCKDLFKEAGVKFERFKS